MRIMHNIPALQSYNALSRTNEALSKSINRLSTGLRINSAADDAAGLAISEKMRAQISGLDMAARNAQDGISMIQTAEGALSEVHSMLQRMRELAVQSANDTLTQEDRSYIQIEVDQLKDEINRISTTTQFNRKQLLDGSAGCIWSTDNLQTKVLVNGGLRVIDQFGQKSAQEGNFRITVDALPGQAQVQKSDLFKIKHPNVIMNVSKNGGAGVQAVRVDGLPAGNYMVTRSAQTAGASRGVAAYVAKMQTAGLAAKLSAIFTATNFSALDIADNQSILFEVVATDTATNSVSFLVQIKGLGMDGKTHTYSESNFLIDNKGAGDVTYANLGWMTAVKSSIALKADATKFLTVGDKFVFNAVKQTAAVTPNTSNVSITIKNTLNDEWPEYWVDSAGDPAGYEFKYSLKVDSMKSNEIHFQQFYLNEHNGTHYESDVVMTYDEQVKPITAGGTGTQVVETTFTAAYIGQVAKGDVQLRDLDKFWDANGKFLLDTPQTLTMIQGDGTKAKFTIYGTDTLEEVRIKMNNAIADGLGQGVYSPNNRNNFVTFVDDKNKVPTTDVSVEGTFVIRSIIPGTDGELSFSGDENIIRAFSLNTIQQSRQSQFRVAAYDAHSGATVATNVKISGNIMYGILAPNIDVRFDPMADIEAKWNDKTQRFDLLASPHVYETIVHLTDNSTILQIGANESEDMSVDIGDMSSTALGIMNLNLSTREAAGKSIGVIDTAIGLVSKQRARLGGYQNRLEYTISNLTTASTNTSAAESRIRDVDMAKEMMEFTKLNILSQAGNSMLAQANNLPNNVMTLLRG